MSSDPEITLRPATIADGQQLFDWRNDPHTRAMSGETGALDFSAHKTWLAAALKNPARRILIGEIENRAIGMLRFDRDGDGEVVSINLAPEARGKGLSAALLRAGMAQGAQTPLLAFIRAENTASLRLFVGAGFTKDGQSDGLLRFRFSR